MPITASRKSLESEKLSIHLIKLASNYPVSSNQAFKALADPTRREILGLLRRGEMTAGDLAERFDMTKPSMSHHFAVLKDADLITSRREGQQIWYGLNTTVVQDVAAWAMDLIASGKKKGTKQK
jgi:DNA-binding transcriptional ArsR family regulator